MDIWETQYGKHRIRVELHYKKILLFIDGEIADQSKYYSPVFEIIYGKLVSQLPSGELVVVNFDGFWKVRCTLFINGKLTNIAKL